MDKPIAVGDLVQVVRSCCSVYVASSPTFVVADVHYQGNATCANCGADLPQPIFASHNLEMVGFPLPWLKRIPPLEELESEGTEETLKETA